MPIQSLEPSDPETVGPYRLLARLGAGGMGRVYLARSAGGRTVAVKVVRADLAEDPEFRERFRREVLAAQAVSGVHTAPVVDADRDGPTPWLATAYVLGPSLTEALAAHGPLPVDSVRALGAGLADALAAIHGAGLIHRDLKPSNVLLAADGPRVIDFGIARALDGDRFTSTGVVVGSPGFMCPEQANGAPMRPAGDVFSLGSVLVYAATGAGPFSQAPEASSSAAALLYRVIHDEPELDAVPVQLLPVIAACLAKDPADRPTPAELAELLGGAGRLRAGWLPAAVASDLATHAAAVLDMETPARGGAAVAGDPRRAAVQSPTEISSPQPADGTVRLGGGTTAAAVVTAPKAASGPSRRLLLTGGGAVLVAALGGAAWALAGSDKPAPHPAPAPTPQPTHPSGSPSPSASPSPTASRAPGMPPVPIWTYKVGHSNVGGPDPICVGDVLYLGGDGLLALGLADGHERWNKPDASAGHLVAASGTLSYGGVSDIFTVDGASGAILWKYDSIPKPGVTVELAADEVLAADDRAVYALCSFMTLDASGLPSDAPQVPGVLALSRKDGSVLWSQHRGATADSSVAATVVKNTLLYTDSKKNLVARSTTTGEQLWFADTDSQVITAPAVDGDHVYCSATGGGLQAVNLTHGEQAWVKNTVQGSRLWYSPPTVADGVVYVVLGGKTVTLNDTTYTPTAPPVLLALKAGDGSELWRLPLQNECSMFVAPFVVQETVFVATDSKGIYAVDTKAHKLRWTFQNGVNTDIEWKFATDGKQLVAVQDDHVYTLPPV